MLHTSEKTVRTGHIAPDILGFYRYGRPDYKRVADMVKLTKEDLGKISKVSKSSVRFDDAIPAAMAIRLREIANIANLVAEFFDGDIHKVALWFELPNPHLGNVSPRTMIRGDRYKRRRANRHDAVFEEVSDLNS